MSIDNTPRHIADTVAASAPFAAYLSGVSVILTIFASIMSMIWLGASLWKMFFPDHFEKFVSRHDRGRPDPGDE